MRIENEELAKKEMKTQVMTYEGEREGGREIVRERDTASSNKQHHDGE